MTDYNREQAELGDRGTNPNDNGVPPEQPEAEEETEDTEAPVTEEESPES